ncbi:TetR/AcrR family transcriptional regulator [Deinococcus sp.]|uniref:TetR/AcrR family transcriptional regulator n=1 Tax=Deinococcus sp. TaxID=47478 RepID=UPI0025D777C3|nr:TetR/AcrR family transcriptional regulator [Deinococcus sp.]
MTDLSLRPLAAALNVSARTLLYHFQSKEELIVEVLGSVSRQQQAWLSAAPAPEGDSVARFAQLWRNVTDPALTPFLRSLFEVELRAMDGDATYRAFASASLELWRRVVQAHLSGPDQSETDPAVSNFVLGTITGLLVDRFSTGDLERTDAAFAALSTTLKQGGLL